MLQTTVVADWFLDRAYFSKYRDRIRGRAFILVLGLHLLFHIVLALLVQDQRRVLPYMIQILIQVTCALILLGYTKFTGRYRVAALVHFVLQRVLMGLVFYRSESLHSIYFASMGTDVVMASFILGMRLATPLVLLQVASTIIMLHWAQGYVGKLPFAMDLVTYTGLMAFSLIMAQLSMIIFSWLYQGSLQQDYHRLQRERTTLFRTARTFDLSRMLGELNHHMNNPLSIVHAQLYRLAMLSKTRPLAPKERQLPKATHEAMQKIRFIVEHLKVLASPDTHEDASPISVRSLCLHILTHFQEKFRLQGISLQFLDQTMNMTFSWRRHELFTILAAIVENAGEAVENSREKRITVRIEHDSHWLTFRICDTGAGIPDEQRAYLFKPFHSTKSGSQHMGLSLLSAKAMLDDRGGTITCEDVAHGCCFQIGLPLDSR